MASDNGGPDSNGRTLAQSLMAPPPALAAGPLIKQHLLALRRRAWLVGLVALLGGGVGFLLAPDDPPVFRALTVLHLTDTRQALSIGLDRAPLQAGNDVASQLELIRSRGIATDVVQSTGYRLIVASQDVQRELFTDVNTDPDAPADSIEVTFGANDYTAKAGGVSVASPYGEQLDLGAVRFTVAEKPGVDRTELMVKPLDAAVEELRANLVANQRNQTQIINVTFYSPDPWMAKQVANAVAEAFQALGVRTAQTQSRERREFVEEQLRQADSLMLESQLALGAFRQHQQAYNAGQRFSAQEEMLLDLEVRREEMATDRRAIDSLVSVLRSSPAAIGNELQVLMAWPSLMTNPLVSQLFARLTQYESEREAAVTAGRALTNPDVQRLDSLIVTTKRNLIDALSNHITALDARIAVLDALKKNTADKLNDLPLAEAEQVRLEQRMETMREMGSMLRQELHRARIAEAVQAPLVEIVDRATVLGGAQRSFPRTIIIGLVAGAFIGGFIAFLLDSLDTSIRSRSEIESLLNIPGLAVVPRLTGGSARPGGITPMRWKRDGRNGRKPTVRTNGTATPVDIFDEKTGREAFRMLRTNLMFAQRTDVPRTIAVTSIGEAEGKTTTAVHLGAAFAEQGTKVLVIDCDLRRPQVHAFFNLDRAPGLTDLLAGAHSPGETIRPIASSSLSVLTAGEAVTNPAACFAGPRMGLAIRALSRHYELILIDTPPVLAAADATIIARLVDSVLLVVRAGETDRSAALEAIRQLTHVGAEVVGVVLNDPEGQVPGYGRYAYYE